MDENTEYIPMKPEREDESPLGLENFTFQRRNGRIDWRMLAGVDADRIFREVDIESLQGMLENIAFADISLEDVSAFTEANFTKLFKVAQMIIEYTLAGQGFLAARVENLEGALTRTQQSLAEVEPKLTRANDEITLLKKENKNQRKMIDAYEFLIKHSGVGRKKLENSSHFSCSACGKAFVARHYIDSHIARRHPDLVEELHAEVEAAVQASTVPLHESLAHSMPVRTSSPQKDIRDALESSALMEEASRLRSIRTELESRLDRERQDARQREEALQARADANRREMQGEIRDLQESMRNMVREHRLALEEEGRRAIDTMKEQMKVQQEKQTQEMLQRQILWTMSQSPVVPRQQPAGPVSSAVGDALEDDEETLKPQTVVVQKSMPPTISTAEEDAQLDAQLARQRELREKLLEEQREAEEIEKQLAAAEEKRRELEKKKLEAIEQAKIDEEALEREVEEKKAASLHLQEQKEAMEAEREKAKEEAEAAQKAAEEQKLAAEEEIKKQQEEENKAKIAKQKANEAAKAAEEKAAIESRKAKMHQIQSLLPDPSPPQSPRPGWIASEGKEATLNSSFPKRPFIRSIYLHKPADIAREQRNQQNELDATLKDFEIAPECKGLTAAEFEVKLKLLKEKGIDDQIAKDETKARIIADVESTMVSELGGRRKSTISERQPIAKVVIEQVQDDDEEEDGDVTEEAEPEHVEKEVVEVVPVRKEEPTAEKKPNTTPIKSFSPVPKAEPSPKEPEPEIISTPVKVETTELTDWDAEEEENEVDMDDDFDANDWDDVDIDGELELSEGDVMNITPPSNAVTVEVLAKVEPESPPKRPLPGLPGMSTQSQPIEEIDEDDEFPDLSEDELMMQTMAEIGAPVVKNGKKDMPGSTVRFAETDQFNDSLEADVAEILRMK